MQKPPTQLMAPTAAQHSLEPAKVLIADDELLARQRLAQLLGDIAPDWPHHVVALAQDGAQALQAVIEQMPDIVLLDIQMPDLSGIQVAQQLQARAKQGHAVPALIFVTAFDQYAMQAFEVDALGYLTKPVRKERLLAALQRAGQLHQAQRLAQLQEVAQKEADTTRSHIPIMERGRLILVPVQDIIYLKSELKYTTVRTVQQEYLTEESLVNLEEEFAQLFLRIHRNALVARACVVGFERATVTDHHEDEQGEGSGTSSERWEVLLRGITERLVVSRRQWAVVRTLLK